jgi:NAD(P)-dependent dehydrogenase (short-subunit alcohol dehydrogenase family)
MLSLAIDNFYTFGKKLDNPKLMETVLITGANSGLGFETAKQFAEKGYKIVIVCRTIKKSNETKSRINEIYPDSKVVPVEAELSSIESIKLCIANLDMPIQIVICNAGISVTKDPELSKDGFELIFSVNHLAHYIFAVELYNKYPKTIKSIIVVSSNVHNPEKTKGQFPEPDFNTLREMAYPKNDFQNWKKEVDKRYVHSKLCNIWFAFGMANRIANQSSAKVNAFNPGFMIGTNLARNRSFITRLKLKYLLPLLKPFIKEMRTVEESAEALIKVALQSEYSGVYFDGSQKAEASLLAQNEDWINELWDFSESLSNTKINIS